MVLFALTISLSAFLLFQVQPIIAKMILPWFGGTSAVWSTCMLFFQAVLLLGYLYAHWLHEKVAARKQAFLHIGFLAASIATLPILPNVAWKTSDAAHPAQRILLLLAVTVGLPYFLLSSTSPLLQAWYSRRNRQGMPYRLFALSNAASMLALLSYPLLVEPNLPVRLQGYIWSGAYLCFTAICGITAWRSLTGILAATIEQHKVEPAEPPSWLARGLWLGLSGCASVLLLAVTTHLTQDVAAIPFLWILPLSIYLLSFIVCFEAPRVYWRPVFIPLFAASLFFFAYCRIWPYHASMQMRVAIAGCAAALFVCCMVCHGELVRLKPHPRYLTGFYVIVSLGGALGGVFVGLVAPNVFKAFHEFPIGLGVCATLVLLILTSDLHRYATIWRYVPIVVMVGLVAGYLYFLQHIMGQTVAGYRLIERNFYGQLKVQDEGTPGVNEYASRTLVHGTINHGAQFFNEIYRKEPVTYFCPQSGIGRAMRMPHDGPRRIGVLGLGCGTLAAYGQPGDTIRIYEINQSVVDIARNEFSYLKDTPAKIEVAMGDGRLTLESEPSQQFDILVMDAFSGDSVPVHLITTEAFRTYFRHLKPGGILAVNVTNTYLDLEPVMERAAAAFDKSAYYYSFEADPDDFLCFSCGWTLILNRDAATQHPALVRNAKLLKPGRPFRTWTDDFSNMLGILK